MNRQLPPDAEKLIEMGSLDQCELIITEAIFKTTELGWPMDRLVEWLERLEALPSTGDQQAVLDALPSGELARVLEATRWVYLHSCALMARLELRRLAGIDAAKGAGIPSTPN